MHLSITKGQLTCDEATIANVQTHFADQLQPYSEPVPFHDSSGSYYNTTIITHYSNETAWQYLGCLQEITSLTLEGYDLASTLPATWGSAGSFVNLLDLVIWDTNLTGTLPEAWGSNGSQSFPQLLNVTVIGNPRLSGIPPAAWGSNGSFASLQMLTMYNTVYGGDGSCFVQ